ncbi:hypothetical protein ACL02R_27695 [Streptomyces sp. MS19]|uniref:hypothetical protein n=1 Tax=Streptomyces sp. MS19 TaxID=3385972 RepID=UPI0039A3C512
MITAHRPPAFPAAHLPGGTVSPVPWYVVVHESGRWVGAIIEERRLRERATLNGEDSV